MRSNDISLPLPQRAAPGSTVTRSTVDRAEEPGVAMVIQPEHGMALDLSCVSGTKVCPGWGPPAAGG